MIDKSQLETAHRLHGEISSVFAYAIVHNLTDYDPAQAVTKQIPAQKKKHRAALINPKQVGQLLRDISNYRAPLLCSVRLGYHPYSSNDPTKHVKCFGQLENAEAISAPPSAIRMQDFLDTGLLNQDDYLFDDNHQPSMVERCEFVAFMLKWMRPNLPGKHFSVSVISR